MTLAQALDQLLPNTELSTEAHPLGMGGLRTADGRAFPLQNVRVRTSIAGPCARTVVEQKFANPFAETLDVTWIFPLPADGAVTDLTLRAGDIVVVGECQRREDALTHFNNARTQGKRAALLETEQAGVQTLSLTGLPPGSEVTVQLTVVELLPVVDARFRWRFPTTIAPRYTPGEAWGHSGFGTSPDTDAVPNASRLTPPLRLSGGTVLDLEVDIDGPLSTLESSLHAVKLSLDSGHVRIAPSARATLDRDFILEFSTADAVKSASRAYTDGTYSVAIVEAPADVTAHTLPRDAVFVVDISGSMSGPKLDAAKAALIGALHGLQAHDRFKLVAFDDNLERFNENFVIYNERNLRDADAWIHSLESRGGTEMLPAIRESLAGETPGGRLRTVLIITDGQSTDEARLLPAVANRRGNAVLFTLGIDTAVNASLLALLARAGGGACELCTPSDDIDAVVARLETRFGTPVLSDVHVKGAARPDGQTVFSGRPATILLEGAPDPVHISAKASTGEFTATVVPQRIDFSLGALWARERVAWLEERLTLKPFEEEAIKPEVVRIALAHRIASKFTSFVCVDHSVNTQGERRHVVQPVELPAQWDNAANVMATGGYAAAPAPMMQMRSAPAAAMFEAAEDTIADFMQASGPSNAASSGPPQGYSLRESVGKLFGGVGRKKSVPTASAAIPTETPPADFAGTLARSQNADGSYGGDIGRTVAALLALLLLGSTRRKGDRRRTVRKIADWLERNRTDARVVLALDALRDAESATGVSATQSTLPRTSQAEWKSFTSAGEEGAMLATLLARAGTSHGV